MDVSSENLGIEKPFVAEKKRQFSEFLKCLQDGWLYSTDLGASPWEFAMALNETRDMNIRDVDLRWMLLRGWIEHRCDNYPQEGALQNADRIEFSCDSRFVIASSGIGILARTEISTRSLEKAMPTWDSQRHELCLQGQVVKRFRWPACNQEMILSAFQEEQWPSRIDDPLPIKSAEPKRRLSDTIKCLNRNQKSNLIRFRGDGTGEGVLWDVVTNSRLELLVSC